MAEQPVASRVVLSSIELVSVTSLSDTPEPSMSRLSTKCGSLTNLRTPRPVTMRALASYTFRQTQPSRYALILCTFHRNVIRLVCVVT
jgi:hypothetical protein